MDDSDLIALMRDVLAQQAAGASGASSPECFDDATIAALADGSLDAGARIAVLPHLAACARCRGAVAAVSRAVSDATVARELRALRGRGRLRFMRIALPLTAAAVLLVIAWPPRPENGGPTHRAPTITAAADPVPLSPVGAVAGAGALRWAAVAGADRYRVTLFDAKGRVLYEAQLPDTVVTLPDSIVLVPGRPHLWKVEARTGFDRWSASTLVEFTVTGGARR